MTDTNALTSKTNHTVIIRPHVRIMLRTWLNKH